MCLSNNRHARASVSFSGTILLGAEVMYGGEVQHLCGYHNRVSTVVSNAAAAVVQPDPADVAYPEVGSGSGPFATSPRGRMRYGSRGVRPSALSRPVASPVAPAAGGNAMLIALPAKAGTVGGDNLIPVGKYPSLMKDYAQALVPPRPRSRGGMRGGSSVPKGVEVVADFDGGVYDVVIADSAAKIVDAIDLVAAAKRPQLNAELYGQLDKLYPGWTFVLFCFAESAAAQAGSALVRYTPMDAYKHLLYLPGLDGHNGSVEVGKVALDHTLLVDSYKGSGAGPGHSRSKRVTFTDPGVQVAMPFLPTEVIGKKVPAGTLVPQGDFLFDLGEVRRGIFRARRALPPGWQSVFGPRPTGGAAFYITGDDA